MASPTQRALTTADIRALARLSFGSQVAVTTCEPLAGGTYAAVWSVALDDGREVVLKVAPPRDVRLLGYEHGLLTAEDEYFRIVRRRLPQVPVPDVLHHGHDDRLDTEWLFTSRLGGVPLPDLLGEHPGLDDTVVRRDIGAAMANVHTIVGDRFGYTADRPHGPTWAAAFGAILDDLLRDAHAWGVDLGDRPDRIGRVVASAAAVLDRVKTAALLHFDLWDGNVLATVDESGIATLTGLVDGERCLFGDPLLDFVSPCIFREIDAGHPFAVGYAATSGTNPLDSPSAAHRLTLYRLHLYLLMVVEMPSRGEAGAEHADKRQFLLDLLDRQLAVLEAS